LPPEEALLAKLSPRQLQVLQCMVNGYSNKKISDTLHVSEETVKSHVTAIFRNLGVENRTQAVMTGARMGFQPENVG
jgi:two-component system nitrate/nitrite response regulator NarL